MGGPKSKATPEEISSAFDTAEAFKAVAKRLGMSPNTLRKRWKAEFGEDVFRERGRKLRARSAAVQARKMTEGRVFRDVGVSCSRCQEVRTLKSNQTSQMDLSKFICEACRCDRECPVCGRSIDGSRGLSAHFRHQRKAGSLAHIQYEQDQEEARWEGKVLGEDYVVCAECDLRAQTLARHLKASHGMTADEYKIKHGGGMLIRSHRLRETRSQAIRSREAGFGKGDQKKVKCPDCGNEHTGSKFLVPGTHNLRCVGCKALEKEEAAEQERIKWVDRTEPDDYVECRLCGWKGTNVLGHLKGVIHSLTVPEYRARFPQAPLWAQEVVTFPTHQLNLTEADLEPFKDKKGRVQVALAADTLGCSWLSVNRYCKILKLPTRNRLATQKRVLDAVAEILEEPYAWEWWHPEIVNPETKYRLYFDGRFEHSNLVVEYQGKQHYEYIPYWHKTEAEFERRKKLDVFKKNRAEELGIRYLEIRYDDPWRDEGWLKRQVLDIT